MIYFRGHETTVGLLTIVGLALLLAVLWTWGFLRLKARNAAGKTLDQLRALSPAEFEEWVEARFRDLGYRTRLTGMAGDHGADLLAEKPGELAIVQCKRYGNHKVSESMLRDLYGAMHDFGAQRAYLVTAGRLTDAARAWAARKPIVVWDGDALARLARERGSKAGAGAEPGSRSRQEHQGLAGVAVASPALDGHAASRPPISAAPASGTIVRRLTPLADQPAGRSSPVCPRCGNALVLRHHGTTGEPFLGCTRFPRCRYSRRIESSGGAEGHHRNRVR